jgi:hypothetical protein
MRNEMVGAVVRRAMEHPEFREQLMQNPEQALQEHGFLLEAEDMAEIHRLRESVGGSDDVQQALSWIAEEYGIDPGTKS